MTDEEAHRVLGVPLGATSVSITAAYHAAAKQYHPDHNRDLDATAAFQRVHEAYRTLCDRPPAQIGGSDRRSLHEDASEVEPNATTADANGTEALAVVRAIMARFNLKLLFDGSIRIGTGPRDTYGPDGQQKWLQRPEDWNPGRLQDAVMDEVRNNGLGLRTDDVKRALRRVVREDQRARENQVMGSLLFGGLDAAERARAAATWSHLVSITLDMDTALGIAVLQHFMWQVKRKQLYLPVYHHLMPVVTSRRQGTGKTTFVRRLLGPLEELASDPVLLSDLSDRRSGDILRFPVVFVDDIEPLDLRQSPVLKGVFTAEAVNRRRLGTSMADKRRQCATLIGTANESIKLLIPDPTGHRRFIELPFRNGAVSKGGDASVWQAVDETDYALLWRSVDGFGPSPILPHLSALAAAQAAAAPVDELRECLTRLDLHSEEVQAITVRGGGVGAEDLRLLACARLRVEIKVNTFSARMAVLVHDPAVPFRPKFRTAKGNIYPFKYH